jgi:hypothetical protein
VIGPWTEFGFLDGFNRDTADFTGTTLMVRDESVGGAADWKMTFTNLGFAGVTEIADTFPSGGVNAVLNGDTLTLTWAGTFTPGDFRAAFELASIPEPAPTAMAGLLFVGAVGYAIRRRTSK